MSTKLFAAGTLLLAFATPAVAQQARLTIIHGIPGLPAPVQVLADDQPLFTFDFGESRGPLDLPARAYRFEVRLNNVPVLRANPTLAAGADYTAIAHLTEAGGNTLSLFQNDITPLGTGNARLTVRHCAQAPAVDVGLTQNSQPAGRFQNLRNPGEAKADVSAARYEATLFPAGQQQPVFGPVPVDLGAGVHVLVYAIGSLPNNSFRLFVQTIDLRPFALQIGTSGTACGGTLGATTLAPAFDVPFTLTLTGATANGMAMLLVGATPQSLDLAALGAPGCTLYTSTDVVLPVPTDATGRASATATVPAALAPILPPTGWQWAFGAPSANALGVLLTDVATLRVVR